MQAVLWLQQFINPALDVIFIGVSKLGEEMLVILLAAFFLWGYEKRTGYKLVFTLLVSAGLNTAVKNIFRVPRPIGAPGVRSIYTESAGGYSFPSGHTQSAAVAYTFLARRIAKRWAWGVAAGLIVLVAISRMYLGLHTLQDVLCGAALGILCALICPWLFDKANLDQGWRGLWLMLPGGALALFGGGHTAIQLGGLLFALAYCMPIEMKWIDYNCQGAGLRRLVAVTCGLAAAFVIKAGLKAVLPDAPLSAFIQYVAMGTGVFLGIPYLIHRMTSGSKRMPLELTQQQGEYAVARFAPGTALEGLQALPGFVSITHTEAETSVVCRQDFLRQLTPAPQTVEHDFTLFKIDGVLDFGLVGILSKLTGILARQHIPVFALSTYDTDYLLVPEKWAELAVEAWIVEGIAVKKDE